jgi:hypothetical protein
MRQRPNFGENLEAFLARHEVIECDHVEALGSKLVQTLIPAEGMPDLESMAREGTFDKAAQA